MAFINLECSAFSFVGTRLFEKIYFTIELGEKVALAGRNGFAGMCHSSGGPTESGRNLPFSLKPAFARPKRAVDPGSQAGAPIFVGVTSFLCILEITENVYSTP
jgi:hypothetical protein